MNDDKHIFVGCVQRTIGRVLKWVPLLACPAVPEQMSRKNTAGQASSGTRISLLLCAQCTIAFAVMSALCLSVSFAAEPKDEQPLPTKFAKLLPLHERLGEPRPGDWLDKHEEPGQTYGQYVALNPIRVDKKRRIIYVQPLGEFTETQKKILDLNVAFLREYYQLRVRVNENMALDKVPDTARRKATMFRSEQFLTTHIMTDMLKPQLRSDAVALIGITAADLWPGEGNYVFGQASYSDRVGVWSMKRFGDPDRDEESFRRCLLRTLKTSVHETGHLFTMLHCTAFKCNMCGCNHLGEADRRPLAICPHCLAKLCYATRADPVKRFRGLMKFYEANGFKAERDFCEKSLEAIRKK